ncbi:MAG: GYD domain-containing protein [Solirubrobacteraceae bacterium]
MAKFLVKASYTAEGAKGVQSAGGTSRRDVVAKMAEGLGGRLESFYFAFGETDAYVVLELPDNVSAAAASIAVNTSGGATSEVVVLLAPEDIDAAAKLSVDYRPPGS